MKKLLAFVLLLSCLLVKGQTTYHGFRQFTVTENTAVTMLVKFPVDTTLGKKFPVIFGMPGDGVIGTDPNLLFGEGLGRQFVIDSALMPDSIIYVLLMHSTTDQALEQPAVLINSIDAFQANTGRGDTLNYMLTGLSQGATNAIEAIVWPPIGFGDPTDYRMKRFKKMMATSMCSLRGSNTFVNAANHGFRLITGSADATCSPSFSVSTRDSLLAYGAYGTYVNIPGYIHDNKTWDSAYSPFSLDSTYNIYLWAQKKTITPAAAPLIAPRIYKYFDFLYSSNDKGHPKYYFDGDVNTIGGPRKFQDYYGFNQLKGGVIHPMTKGYSRVIGWIDLVGSTDLNDTSKRFEIDSIYGYNKTEANHKVYFASDSGYFALPVHQRRLYNSRPDLYWRPFDSLTTTSAEQWVNGSLNRPIRTRYLYIMVTGDTGTLQIAKFGELRIRGKYLYDTAANSVNVRPPLFTGAMPNQITDSTTLGLKSGTNWFNAYGPNSRAHDGFFRSYYDTWYDDTATAIGVPAAFKLSLNTFSDLNIALINQIKSEGKSIYFTNQVSSQYVQNNGGSIANLDTVGKLPYDPNNWRRESWLKHMYTRVLGRVTTGTNIFTGSVANGQNLVKFMGTGNELNQVLDNEDLFIMQCVDADGYEDSVKVNGNSTGIWRADSSMRIVQSAMIDHDSMQIATHYFYSQTQRYDKRMPYDVIAMHKYLDNTDSLGGIQRDNTDKVGARSASPEEAINSHTGLIKHLDTLLRRIYAFLPTSTQVWWDETGRSQTGTVAIDANQAGTFDQSTTPGFGGWDSLSAKAILNVRELLETVCTPIRRRAQYSLVNQFGSSSGQPIGRFYSMGRGNDKSNSYPFEVTTFYPDWHLNACVTDALYHWAGEVITDGGRLGIWNLKFHDMVHTDSLAQVDYYGSRQGASGTHTLAFPAGVTQVRVVNPSLSSDLPTVTTAYPSSGLLTVNTNEMPVIYMYSTISALPAPGCTTYTSPANNATLGTTTTADLYWADAANATGYDLYVYLNGGSLPTPIDVQAASSYHVTGLTPGGVYKWYVNPKNATGVAAGCATGYQLFTTAASTVALPFIPFKIKRN